MRIFHKWSEWFSMSGVEAVAYVGQVQNNLGIDRALISRRSGWWGEDQEFLKYGVREGIFKFLILILTQTNLVISYYRKLYLEAWEMGGGGKKIPLGYFSYCILLNDYWWKYWTMSVGLHKAFWIEYNVFKVIEYKVFVIPKSPWL